MRKTKIAKTTKRKTYRRKGGKKATPTKGLASVPKSYQIINTIKPRIYKFEDTFQYNDIVGTGASIASADLWQISNIARYTALISMFRQYRINFVKYRFRLENLELTDNANVPLLYVKYNYDPNILAGVITENYMLRQSNVVLKTFIAQGGASDLLLEYTVKPAVMSAYKLFNSTNYVPNPAFNRWCDFDPSGTVDEVEHYGIQYYITNLPSGLRINVDVQLGYECRDLI